MVATEIHTGRGEAGRVDPAVISDQTGTADSSMVPDDRVIVYYFHGNKRCNTCRAIEEYTEEAVNIWFGDELRSGKLDFRVVNVEEPGNEHFVDDYELSARSVVLSALRNGREAKWTRLDRVWQLVRDRDAFVEYITDSTNAFLAGNHG
jgi:hypothetical protein